MKTENNILKAFILNLAFSVFEFFGGIFTGSIAILSDAVHDIGDAVSIGISYLLEKKSKKQPDEKYTYGYARYSVLGSVITTLILLLGSVVVIINAICRLIEPTAIHYNGMIVFAVIGVVVNFCAAFFTRGGESINQKAVNLHMLEDVLGWGVVLIGAIIIGVTGFMWIDPVMSIGVAVFILGNAIKNLTEVCDLFLEKTPKGIEIKKIKERLIALDGILDVHHIHIWSMDGQHHFATMHIVTNADPCWVKETIRHKLWENGIAHITLEIEAEGEQCPAKNCYVEPCRIVSCHHHHH